MKVYVYRPNLTVREGAPRRTRVFATKELADKARAEDILAVAKREAHSSTNGWTDASGLVHIPADGKTLDTHIKDLEEFWQPVLERTVES